MVEIDRRKKYFMVLDVETAGTLGQPLCYDIGFLICDKKGKIYQRRSFIVKEIFYNSELMSTAYYREKIPRYLDGIGKGEIQVETFAFIRAEINQMLKTYRVSTFCAYNLEFDKKALGYTFQYLGGKGKFLQSSVEMLCIWSFACEVIYTQPTFQKLAREQNWMSKAGNIQTTAEIGYRYLSKDTNFVESHTGLEDCIIESQIMAKCFAQHKKHISGIIGHPWRIPNTNELKVKFM
jgi:hypothetical protein